MEIHSLCEQENDYGVLADDLALTFKAVGGLYIGDGVAPKIVEKLRDGAFMRAFRGKGRMSSFSRLNP